MDNKQIGEFLRQTKVSIFGNRSLREPQIEGYYAICNHFRESSEECYVQLPVGCGKTGLMGITPFGLSEGRVLFIAPNLQIRTTIIRELDVSDPNCFYVKRGVFVPKFGPFITELKTGANIHDCDNAHFIVSNIQQFVGQDNKWYERFPKDYFSMILVDEGHHNVADTWQRLFQYFDKAKVVSVTATPLRSDGKQVRGVRVYSYGYGQSMIAGFISPVEAVFVKPEMVSFTAKNTARTISIKEVLKMRKLDWFSKGIALSEPCNRHIVLASIKQLAEVRKFGTPRQIIAVACSIRHATQIAALYGEYGLKAEVLHSKLKKDKRDQIEAALRQGLYDVIVQVRILGEGYDLGSLSIAAVFRPYRSLSPYIQFVGRILRLAVPSVPHSPANRVYVVSHVGLNDERWWSDFTQFDTADQRFFAEYLAGSETELGGEGETPRMTLRPFMKVLSETVQKYVQRSFLTEVDETMVQEIFATIRSKGFDPSEFGLTERMVKTRLELAAKAEKEIAAFQPLVQPQRRKESLKKKVYQEARSIAHVIMSRLNLPAQGRNLLRHFPHRGESNSAILISLALGRQNNVMNISSGKREDASLEQFEAALDASAMIADALTSTIRKKLESNNAQKKVTT